jgi:hypothetical protein
VIAAVFTATQVHSLAAHGDIVSTPIRGTQITIPQVARSAMQRAAGDHVTVVLTQPLPGTTPAATIDACRAEGWIVSDSAADRLAETGWVTLRRPTGARIHIHVQTWRTPAADQIGALWAPDADAATIIDRLGTWHATAHRPWHSHPVVVAAESLIAVTEERSGSRGHHGVVWRQRGRTWTPPSLPFTEWTHAGRYIEAHAGELTAEQTIGYDGNGEYLAALSAAELPYTLPEPVPAPGPFDPRIAGWWLVDTTDSDGADAWWWTWATTATTRPPLIRLAPNSEGRVWLSTPVMRYLAERDWEPTPVAAYLPSVDKQGRRRSGRIFRAWAEEWSQVRTAFTLAGDTVMTDAVKAIYATAVSSAVASETGRIWRPDWRALIWDHVSVMRHRRISIAEGRLRFQPVATKADAVWYVRPDGPLQQQLLDATMGLRARHLLGGTKYVHTPPPGFPTTSEHTS